MGGIVSSITDGLFGDSNDPYKASGAASHTVDQTAFDDPEAEERKRKLLEYQNMVAGRGPAAGIDALGGIGDKLAAIGSGEAPTTAETTAKILQDENVAKTLGAVNAGPGGGGSLRDLAGSIGQGNRQAAVDAVPAASKEKLGALEGAAGAYGSQGKLGLTQTQLDDDATQFGIGHEFTEDQQGIQNAIDREKLLTNQALGVASTEAGSFDASQGAKRDQRGGLLQGIGSMFGFSDANVKTNINGPGAFSDANAKMNITSDANAKTNVMSDIGTKVNISPEAFAPVAIEQAKSGNPFQTAPAMEVPTFQGQTREELIASGMSEEEANKSLMGQAGDRAAFDKASRESMQPPPQAPAQETSADVSGEADGTMSMIGDTLMETRYGKWLPYVGVQNGINYINGKPEVSEDISIDDTVGMGSSHPGEALGNKEDAAPLTNEEEKAAGTRDWTDDLGDFMWGKKGSKERKGRWDSNDKDTGAQKIGKGIGKKLFGEDGIFSDIDTKKEVKSNVSDVASPSAAPASNPNDEGGEGVRKLFGGGSEDTVNKVMDTVGSIFGGAGGAAAMFSDMHTKENVGNPEVDQFFDALTPYTYDYKDPSMGEGRQLGVMAQDVEKGGPVGESMVFETPQGKALDGKKMMSAAMAGLADMNARLDELEMGKGNFKPAIPPGIKTVGGGSGGGSGDVPPRKPQRGPKVTMKKKKK